MESPTDRFTEQTEEPWRDPAARDIDRLMYSTAWRRLEGVTQVTPISGRVLTHNRLTHSLKVAQVGRRVAERLKYEQPGLTEGLQPTVVEAAGFAHDLGHPPFGHVAESALQGILENDNYEWKLEDSFEGNAQSFRVITNLVTRTERTRGMGLNLTRATLAALLKYPWFKGRAEDRLKVPASHKKYYAKKWGSYATESEEFDFALKLTEGWRSLEADIMDFADDITYAIHDVQDYFRAGLIPLHSLGQGFIQPRQSNPEYERFWDYAVESITLKSHIDFDPDAAKKLLAQVAQFFPESAYGDTQLDRIALHAFASGTVEICQQQLTVVGGQLRIDPPTQMALEVLKELVWYYVINHPQLATSQEGQRRIVKHLHQWLCEWIQDVYRYSVEDEMGKKRVKRNKRRLPARLLALAGDDMDPDDKILISRCARDYIATLTDAQANDLHAHLGGYVDEVSSVNWL